MRAVEVASNWRAFVLLAGGSLISLVLIFTGVKLASGGFVLPVFFSVLAFAAFVAGISATGIALMDDAKGFAPRTVMNAALAGLFTLPRFLGLILLFALTLALYTLVIALLFFVCKVPLIGPFLYAFVFPAAALLTGVVSLGLLVALLVLAAPMIWEGHGIMATMARLWTVLRQRLLMVFMNWILLSLLVSVIGAVIMVIVSLGTLITLPLSKSVIGQNFGISGLDLLMSLAASGSLGDGSGYVLSGVFGSAALTFIAFTFPVLVHIKGVCLIYLAAVDGIKFEEAELALAKRVADVKQRADAVRERSMQATARSVTSSPNPQFAAERDGATSIPSGCPKCGNAVTVDDIFCGSCGQKL